MKRAGLFTFGNAIKAMAILTGFVVFMAIWTNLRFGIQTDFVSFWAAAKLALIGNPAAAFDLDAHKAMEMTAVAVEGLIPFPYPPPYLLVIVPFGLLPYAVAHALWVSVTLSAYLAAAQRLVPGAALMALAMPAAIICGIGGQNSFLLTALFMFGMVAINTRPFLAGLILGLMVIKPHLGVLLPMALIAGREWRAFAGATLSSLALTLVSFLVFGAASWIAFFDMLSLAREIAANGLVSWNKMASVYAALRLLGVPTALAASVHIVVAVAAAAVLWRTWRASADPVFRAAVLGCATMTMSPYLFIYDQVLLLPAFAYLWQRGGNEKMLAALFGMAVLSLAGNFYPATTINVAPLLPIALLALLWRHCAIEPDRSQNQAAFGADCLTPSST
jgi:hypothetical protein